MCHFYRDREELVEALVPFFIAGLHSNERCIWITAEPLNAAGAKLELQKAELDVDAAIRSGALTVQDYSEFYLKAAGMKSSQVAKLRGGRAPRLRGPAHHLVVQLRPAALRAARGRRRHAAP
jgi:hypothetical protein